MEWTAIIPPLLMLLLKFFGVFISEKAEEREHGKTIFSRRRKFDKSLVNSDVGDLNRRFDDINIKLRKTKIARDRLRRGGDCAKT